MMNAYIPMVVFLVVMVLGFVALTVVKIRFRKKEARKWENHGREGK